MRKLVVSVLGVFALAAFLLAPSAGAATTVASKLQLRGHLPELGERPAMRVFQTSAAYDSFRASLGDANLFPPASSMFMSFDRDILALYARGNDTGGRCLRTGPSASLDGDTATLDLQWETGTCGAPISAHYPFILVSLSRTAADGSSWIAPTRSVCATAPGTDPRACASLGTSATSPSPAPTASPAATVLPTAAPTATATPAATATRTATPTVTATATIAAVTSPTRSPVAVASPTAAPPPSAGGGPDLVLAAALVAVGVLIGIAVMAARRPRRSIRRI